MSFMSYDVCYDFCPLRFICSLMPRMYALNSTEYVWCPAGIWRLHNVALTSMQCHDVAAKLMLRCMDVLTLNRRYCDVVLKS